MTKEERYKFYNTKLLSSEGLTKNDFLSLIDDEIKSKRSKNNTENNSEKGQGKKVTITSKEDQYRKDIEKIKKLFNKHKVNYVYKDGVLRLLENVNLVHLDLAEKSKSLSSQLIDLLSHSKFGLPEPFISEMQAEGSEALMNTDGKYKLSFDTVYADYDFEYFLELYKSIDKHCLEIEYHTYSDISNTKKIFLYPEFLKQYNSVWYIFGPARDEDCNYFINRDGEKTDEFKSVFYLDVKLIDKIKVFNSKFEHSGIDYSMYYSDIIGVDNINRDPVEVKLLVKDTMIERIQSNPIHESFDVYPNRKSPVEGYSVANLIVKHNRELERIILSYGSDVIVVSPKKLKDRINKEFKKLSELYQLDLSVN